MSLKDRLIVGLFMCLLPLLVALDYVDDMMKGRR